MDASLPQLIEDGIVHEITHFYRVMDTSWFGDGTANFLVTQEGFELYNQEVAPRSNRSSYANDVTNITELVAAYPGYYPKNQLPTGSATTITARRSLEG